MITELEILRPPATSVCTIQIDEKAMFKKFLMGDWQVEVEYVSPTVLPIQIGD